MTKFMVDFDSLMASHLLLLFHITFKLANNQVKIGPPGSGFVTMMKKGLHYVNWASFHDKA
jgi:hypothetical protein